MPAYRKALNFYNRHGGLGTLVRLIELCNKEPDLKRIAFLLQLSPSQISRLRNDLMEKVWRPKMGVVKLVEEVVERKNKSNGELLQLTQELKEETRLTLIMGKAMGWVKK